MTNEFYQVLRRSSGSWKRVGSIKGIREVAGEYVCIEGAQDLYLKMEKSYQKTRNGRLVPIVWNGL